MRRSSPSTVQRNSGKFRLASCFLFVSSNTIKAPMRWRSSTHAYIATIGSRTKTRRSVIRILSIRGVTLGLVQHFRDTKQRSILRLLRPKRALGLLTTFADTVVKNSRISPSQTGTADSSISLQCTSLESATMRRSSIVPTISDNI